MPYDSMKALDYVIQNGTVFETYKLEVVLGLGKDNKIPLEFFKSVQNDDGGFAHMLVPGNPSSIETTLKILPWYDELELSFSGSYKQAINYVLDVRHPKGYWKETIVSPPSAGSEKETMKKRIELTSEAASILFFLEDKEYLASRAVEYLETQTGTDGSLKESVLASWSLYSLYGQLGMKEKMKKLEKVLFGKKIESIEEIMHSLLCIKMADGRNATELLDALESMQNEDGSWQSQHSTNVETTIDAVRILKRYHR